MPLYSLERRIPIRWHKEEGLRQAWASFVALPLLAVLPGDRSLHLPEPQSLPGKTEPQRLQRDGEMVRVHGCGCGEQRRLKLASHLWYERPQRALSCTSLFSKIIMYAESAAKGGFEAANPLFYK